MRVSRDCAAFQEWKQEMSEFGQRLDKLIKDSGKTQRDVAKDLGITEAWISTWKNGEGYTDIRIQCLAAVQVFQCICRLAPDGKIRSIKAPASSSGTKVYDFGR